MDRQKAITRAYRREKQLRVSTAMYRRGLERYFSQELGHEGKDTTSRILVPSNKKSSAFIKANEPGIIAGTEEVIHLLKKQGIIARPLKNDGSKVRRNDKILLIRGKLREILRCERIILNILQRMSGIATQTYRLKKKFRNIAATRKTVLRLMDKKAVSVGGGLTHRLSLSDGIIIKDNHVNHVKLLSRGSIKALSGAKTPFIEIEVDKQPEVIRAAEFLKKIRSPAVGIIMLDNFTPRQIRKSITQMKKSGLYSNILIEASGGITGENIPIYRGVDVISLGCLTHSAKALNLGLELSK